MKFSISASLYVLLGVASALPTEIEVRAPSNAPINVSSSEPQCTCLPTIPIQLINGPDSSKSYKCGDNTYSYHEIYLAAQRGTNLHLVGETRGSKFYPYQSRQCQCLLRLQRQANTVTRKSIPTFVPQRRLQRRETHLPKGLSCQ
jgi:hypothetical protein